jgi:2,3-bisphosphoglycerate-dependent phosphoglycerate mutase
MNNLILVRHGQSLWNKERRFTGWADIELTDKGKAEAENAGQLIKKLNIVFDSYFTSELARAKQTLDVILKTIEKKKVNIIRSTAFNERHYGNLTGLNKDETIKKYGTKQVQLWRRSFDIAPPPMDKSHPFKNKINSQILSESLKQTFDRVVPFYKKNVEPLILDKKNIIIVLHGNTIRALLMKIFSISKKKIDKFEIPTGNPLLIRFADKLNIKDYKYLNKERAKKILFNV